MPAFPVDFPVFRCGREAPIERFGVKAEWGTRAVSCSKIVAIFICFRLIWLQFEGRKALLVIFALPRPTRASEGPFWGARALPSPPLHSARLAPLRGVEAAHGRQKGRPHVPDVAVARSSARPQLKLSDVERQSLPMMASADVAAAAQQHGRVGRTWQAVGAAELRDVE